MKKKWEFSNEDIIKGKNKADLYEGIFVADYIEYEIGDKEGHAYNNEEGSIIFYLDNAEIERLETFEEEITAGDIFTSAWEFYDSRDWKKGESNMTKIIKNLKENAIIEQLEEIGKINVDYIDEDLELLIEVLEEEFKIEAELQDLVGGRYLVNLNYQGD